MRFLDHTIAISGPGGMKPGTMGRSHRSMRVNCTNSSTSGVDSKHQAGSNRTKPASVQAIDGHDVRQELPYLAKAAFSTMIHSPRAPSV